MTSEDAILKHFKGSKPYAYNKNNELVFTDGLYDLGIAFEGGRLSGDVDMLKTTIGAEVFWCIGGAVGDSAANEPSSIFKGFTYFS